MPQEGVDVITLVFGDLISRPHPSYWLLLVEGFDPQEREYGGRNYTHGGYRHLGEAQMAYENFVTERCGGGAPYERIRVTIWPPITVLLGNEKRTRYVLMNTPHRLRADNR